jgi:hypothetical protein
MADLLPLFIPSKPLYAQVFGKCGVFRSGLWRIEGSSGISASLSEFSDSRYEIPAEGIRGRNISEYDSEMCESPFYQTNLLIIIIFIFLHTLNLKVSSIVSSVISFSEKWFMLNFALSPFTLYKLTKSFPK